jgi:hypothetical protein
MSIKYTSNKDVVIRLRATALEGCSVTDWTKLSWDIQEAADQIEQLRSLLKLFDNHYVCELCAELSASYLDNCDNPLHKLHDAAWDIES